MKPRSREEAAILIQQHRNKPRTPRKKPERREFKETAIPCDEEMARAGFRIVDTSKTMWTRGVFVSAVTKGTPDRYYFHPRAGLSVWSELKSLDGRLSDGQREFIEAHRHNPLEVVVWKEPADCHRWLEGYGLRVVVDGKVTYPQGDDAPQEEGEWQS